MSDELKLGKFEFYPNNEKSGLSPADFQSTSIKDANAEEEPRAKFEKLLDRLKRLKQTKTN